MPTAFKPQLKVILWLQCTLWKKLDRLGYDKMKKLKTIISHFYTDHERGNQRERENSRIM